MTPAEQATPSNTQKCSCNYQKFNLKTNQCLERRKRLRCTKALQTSGTSGLRGWTAIIVHLYFTSPVEGRHQLLQASFEAKPLFCTNYTSFRDLHAVLGKLQRASANQPISIRGKVPISGLQATGVCFYKEAIDNTPLYHFFPYTSPLPVRILQLHWCCTELMKHRMN